MKPVIEFIKKLFSMTRSSTKIKDEIKTEIYQTLEDAIDKVGRGTEKIDEQIKDLKDIQRRIEIESGVTPVDDLIGDLAKKTGATPEETRRVLIDTANEGYLPGDPKRMLDDDDDRLRAFIESQKLMGNEEDLMREILENAELPPETKRGIEQLAKESTTYKDLGKTDVGIPKDESLETMVDRLLKLNKQRQVDLKAAEDKMADPANLNKGLGQIMQEVQDDKVVDLAKFRKAKDPVDDMAMGGRVGFTEGGNDDKKGITRRGFIKGAGALGLLGLIPGLMKGKTGIKAAQTATQIQKVPGMPDWFPLLVNKIRKMGKVTREPNYKDFTSGGDLDRVTELKVGNDKYLLYENQQSGNIVVTGRGNESQQVSMEYLPGETMAVKDKSGNLKLQTDNPSFEAGEYAKGEFQDFENIGVGFDDLKGDVSNWENFAKGGSKVDVEKAVDDFIKSEVNPNITEGFAQGGGVGTLFKRKAM
jgi:hypothetical protein